MKRLIWLIWCLLLATAIVGCAKSYKAAPVSFKSPATLGNTATIEGAEMGARVYDEKQEAERAFGFDIIGAGMLPVQVVFDNQGEQTFEIRGDQSFLEDHAGNLWPVLSREMAYARASQHAQTDQALSKGTTTGLMGAVAGALIGSAIGIVTGKNVGAIAGTGAVIGGTAGLLGGGIEGYHHPAAQQAIAEDLRTKSLQNKTILPHTMAYGILFYPAEAEHAKKLQLCLVETDTGRSHRLMFDFSVE